MNSQPFIREYNPNDQKNLIQLFRLNTPEYFAIDEEIDFIHYLDNEIDFYYVIELDDKIVGCGGINFKDETTGVISWGIIHPEFQRKSLGSLLLKHRVRELQKFENIETIKVRTSQLVHQFYAKNGFVLVNIIDNYWAEGFHLYEMNYEII